MNLRTKLSGLILAVALIATSCASDATVSAADSTTSSTTTTTAPSETVATTSTPTTLEPVEDSTGETETSIPEPTPTTAAPGPDGPAILTSYEFAPGLVDGRPTQVQGLLGVPAGPGPFPVAIVMHGSHPPCVDDFIPETFSEAIVTETNPSLCGAEFPEYIRHDVGLGHVVIALNDVGIAAVSIDVESAYVWWGGEPFEFGTVEEIIETHVDVLTRLDDGEDLGLGIDSISDRLALDQISLIGHSRSGGHVVSILEASSTLPFDPLTVVAIEPDVGFPPSDLLDVPVLLIRGECDEDVGAEAGRDFLVEVLDPARLAPAIDLFIPAAGHRMLNTGLNGSTCPERGDRSLIQAQLARGVSSFVASSGQQIELLDDVGATVETLRGNAPIEEVISGPVGYDPQRVPNAVSTVELVPPLPQDADYSDALIEDF